MKKTETKKKTSPTKKTAAVPVEPAGVKRALKKPLAKSRAASLEIKKAKALAKMDPGVAALLADTPADVFDRFDKPGGSHLIHYGPRDYETIPEMWDAAIALEKAIEAAKAGKPVDPRPANRRVRPLEERLFGRLCFRARMSDQALGEGIATVAEPDPTQSRSRYVSTVEDPDLGMLGAALEAEERSNRKAATLEAEKSAALAGMDPEVAKLLVTTPAAQFPHFDEPGGGVWYGPADFTSDEQLWDAAQALDAAIKASKVGKPVAEASYDEPDSRPIEERLLGRLYFRHRMSAY